ncbi:hypothetical protein Mal33_43440 [Rosistilla oblonga]|uniref:Uncharacterized protein n=1 Tax=Rosistilla oblonga TaxID=2527990 RepID=A0A518IZ05_9BACT|nr:hypothetical protein Mal33_43440 [Rosistilla oblonga]
MPRYWWLISKQFNCVDIATLFGRTRAAGYARAETRKYDTTCLSQQSWDHLARLAIGERLVAVGAMERQLFVI